MACQSRRSLFLVFLHMIDITIVFKQRKSTSIYVNTVISEALLLVRIAFYMSQGKPNLNTSRKISYAKLFNKCNYFYFNLKWKRRSGFYWPKTLCHRLTQLCKHVVILDQPTPISH